MDEPAGPREGRARIFLRFLRFGALAWGGPVAQIGMLRDELVEREERISPERFNRTLAVYQALPGPEAHELCVYFGYLAGGRVGGLVAGLGFMLPGFVAVLVVAWAYVRFGLTSAVFAGVLAGFQPAVAALIVRAVIRIGRHILTRPWLWVIAAGAALAQVFDAPFWIPLAAGGAVATLSDRRHPVAAIAALAVGAAAVALTAGAPVLGADPGAATVARGADPSLLSLLGTGLKAGLLTFGGAYTAIPYVRGDAVVTGRWMTDAQFLDALALSGILPAPLVIFGTFVGYVGGGFDGAAVMTLGIFAPAFAFTLIGHAQLERMVHQPATHAFLDGVAAAVVGLIAVTAIRLMPAAIPDPRAAAIFAGALLALTFWRARWAVAGVVLGAGAAGLLLERW